MSSSATQSTHSAIGLTFRMRLIALAVVVGAALTVFLSTAAISGGAVRSRSTATRTHAARLPVIDGLVLDPYSHTLVRACTAHLPLQSGGSPFTRRGGEF